MSISVLIVTRNLLGQSWFDTARSFADTNTYDTESLAINDRASPDVLIPHIGRRIAHMDNGKGVLVLTDASQGMETIWLELTKEHAIQVVTGLNLPMLIGVMAADTQDLSQLAELAQSSAHQGIHVYRDAP